MELRNSPVQARSVDRLATILDAARPVLQEVGRDRLTTGMVAEAAGCSIGTLYRYFPDRVAVLDAIAPDRDLAEQKRSEAAELVEFWLLGDGGRDETEGTMQVLWQILRPRAEALSAEELAKVHAFGLDVAEVAS